MPSDRTPDNPDGWEPIPWDADQPLTEEQRRGFFLRAAKPVIWSRIDPATFPSQSIFGNDREWFVVENVMWTSILVSREPGVLLRSTPRLLAFSPTG